MKLSISPIRIGAAAAIAALAGAARAQVGGDFNGDGYRDLVIGAPFEGIDPAGPTPNQEDAGAVWVIFGSPLAPGTESGGLDPCAPPEGGAAPIGDQLFYQGKPAGPDSGAFPIPDAPETGDHFGWSLAVGRFNADAYDDLAIGIPNESTPNETGVLQAQAGMVVILFGGPNGLNTTCPPQTWTQASAGIADSPEGGDHFGYTLAAGNFNSDFASGNPSLPLDDLAIGAPHENRLVQDDGVVHAIYNGAAAGLCGLGHGDNLIYPTNELLAQGLAGFPDAAEALDHFGLALAAGDVTGDGVEDLVVGVPDEDLSPGTTANDHGMLHGVTGVPGPAGGLLAPTALATTHVKNTDFGPAIGDRYGAALAIGNFDGADAMDLAVGIPTDDAMWIAGPIADSGSVEVIYGPLALPPMIQFWAQNGATSASGPLGDGLETNDQFGFSLAAADFDGNGVDDLAIGVPWENLTVGTTPKTDAGAAHVIYGAPVAGLDEAGPGCAPPAEFWCQSPQTGWSDLVGAAEDGDLFAFSLGVGDFDANGADDLVFGVPGEDIGTAAAGVSAGLVTVLYGRTACNQGLDSTISLGDGAPEDEEFHQGTGCPAGCVGCGVQGGNEASDQFGFAQGIR